MKYESPELVTLTPAIIGIQAVGAKLITANPGDGHSIIGHNEHPSGYTDWE